MTDPVETDADEIVDPAMGGVPFDQLMAVWDDVVADMEATAEEYRETGYEVVELHPGDVAAVGSEDAERWGLDVLVPDNEIPEVERLVAEEGHEFDSCEVFKAEEGGIVFMVVAFTADATEKAILVPAYYDPSAAGEMFERAHEHDEMRIHVRDLQKDTVVTFSQDDVSLFAPEQPD